MNSSTAIIAFALAAAALIAVLALSIYVGLKQTPPGRAYNCSLVEISPDVPPAAREACRRARGGQQ
jgi:hypothetical protein